MIKFTYMNEVREEIRSREMCIHGNFPSTCKECNKKSSPEAVAEIIEHQTEPGKESPQEPQEELRSIHREENAIRAKEIADKKALLQKVFEVEDNKGNEPTRENLSVLPEPNTKDVPTDGAYRGQTFWRFGPEQRTQIKEMASSYNGIRYNVGEKVFVMGGEAEVLQFNPGGEITAEIDYGADPSGTIWREEAKPATLLLRSLENPDGSMFTVVAGKDSVKKIS